MNRLWLFAVFSCASVAALACGSSSRSGFGNGTGSSNAGNDPSLATPDGGTLTSGVAPTGVNDGCADETRQIYLVTEEKDLIRFSPKTMTLTTVGKLNCKADGETPFSMAVDRTGIAWVEYSDGKLWRVDTKTAACTATTFAKDQGDFSNFGMGFATNGVGSQSETLYIANNDGYTLGKIDTTSLLVTKVGNYDGFPGEAELTGNANGQLFGFFPPTDTFAQSRVVELDTGTGKMKDLKTVAGQDFSGDSISFAFSFWGGDFYMFVGNDGESTITRYNYDSGDSSTVKDGLPYMIIGAGVSTCAPVTNPK